MIPPLTGVNTYSGTSFGYRNFFSLQHLQSSGVSARFKQNREVWKNVHLIWRNIVRY